MFYKGSEPPPQESPNSCSVTSSGTASISAHIAKTAVWNAPIQRGMDYRLDGNGHLIGGGFLRRGRAHSCIGEPGAGKSLLLIHASLCLVTGAKFFGRPVQRSRVVFFAAEAASSTLDRFVVAARRAGLGWPVDGLCVLPIPLDLKDSKESDRAIALLKRERADAFFLDTANASGAGAEDNQDMPKFAQAISKMVLQTRAAGMITHHTPIANGARERGHTSLRGMLDLSVVVQKKPNSDREISYSKARDGEEAPFGTYRIAAETLGQTNLGEPFAVPFLVEGECEPRQRTAKKVILDELGTRGGNCSRQDLQEAFMRERPGTKWESVKRGFNKAIQELQDDGIIEISGDSVILKKR